MTVSFDDLKARLLANPKVKMAYDALARNSRFPPSWSRLDCARACPRPNSPPAWVPRHRADGERANLAEHEDAPALRRGDRKQI